MRPQGQLDRALGSMTIDLLQNRDFRKRTLYDTRTGEYEQQVHVPFSGAAGSLWGFADQAVNWEMPFVYAPAQRRVPFETPHFTYGIELLNPGSSLVHFGAHVVAWNITDAGWYIGATVRLCVVSPDATVQVPYSAIAHLSFQGYAAYAEGDELAQ